MKTKFQRQLFAVALTGALASVATVARADDTVAAPTAITPPPTPAAAPLAADGQETPWQFGVTIPLWAPQINGNSTIKGVQRDVDIRFSELKDHLDASLALGLEARKGKFGIYGGFGYMKFSFDDKTKFLKSDAGLKFCIADAGVSYRLLKTESEHPFVLEGTLGVRYWYADLDLKLKDSLGNVLFNESFTKDLVDPMVGLRGSQYFTRKFHLDFAGDIGGFGMSDNQATLDWSATGVLTYDFCKFFSLSGGYKAIGLNASSGSGAKEDGLDVIFSGFLLAAKFKF